MKTLRNKPFLAVALALLLGLTGCRTGEAPPPQLEAANHWDTRNQSKEALCLAQNIYHESRGESFEGKLAVAQVTLNRVAHKTLFKSTICGVVYQNKQFSWTSLPKSVKDKNAWEDAQKIAKAVMGGLRLKDFDAIYYHTHAVKPSWRVGKQIVKVIGSHIFYA